MEPLPFCAWVLGGSTDVSPGLVHDDLPLRVNLSRLSTGTLWRFSFGYVGPLSMCRNSSWNIYIYMYIYIYLHLSLGRSRHVVLFGPDVRLLGCGTSM